MLKNVNFPRDTSFSYHTPLASDAHPSPNPCKRNKFITWPFITWSPGAKARQGSHDQIHVQLVFMHGWLSTKHSSWTRASILCHFMQMALQAGSGLHAATRGIAGSFTFRDCAESSVVEMECPPFAPCLNTIGLPFPETMLATDQRYLTVDNLTLSGVGTDHLPRCGEGCSALLEAWSESAPRPRSRQSAPPWWNQQTA